MQEALSASQSVAPQGGVVKAQAAEAAVGVAAVAGTAGATRGSEVQSSFSVQGPIELGAVQTPALQTKPVAQSLLEVQTVLHPPASLATQRSCPEQEIRPRCGATPWPLRVSSARSGAVAGRCRRWRSVGVGADAVGVAGDGATGNVGGGAGAGPQQLPLPLGPPNVRGASVVMGQQLLRQRGFDLGECPRDRVPSSPLRHSPRGRGEGERLEGSEARRLVQRLVEVDVDLPSSTRMSTQSSGAKGAGPPSGGSRAPRSAAAP